MKEPTKGLRALPLRELRKLARENSVPMLGTARELAARLEKALPAAHKVEVTSSFLETKRAFSYRFYRMKRGSPRLQDIARAVTHRDPSADPFRTELRPPLANAPQVYRARLTADGVLYLSIAFAGEARLVQNGWDELEVAPPVLAVVGVREGEGLVELRGRWEKVAIIEQWIQESLGIGIEHLKFTNNDLQRLRKLLNAKLATQTIRPNAGGIASIRIATSGPDVDLEDNKQGQGVHEVFSQVGYQRRNPGFVYNPTRVRVRANEKEGSFYIPKHATEAEVTVLRHGFLVTMGLMDRREFAVPDKEVRRGAVRRKRLLTPANLQERLERVDTLTAAERRTVVRVLRLLQVDQQERLFPGLWSLWLPDKDGEHVANQLVRAGVLEKAKEAQCPKCGFTGPADGYPAKCPECEATIEEPSVFYRVRGFIEPQVAEDDVFKPDHRKMAELYREVARTRDPNSRATNEEKKKALENLAEHLFESLEGLQCTGKNVRTSVGEIDRIFRNENTTHALLQKLGLSVRVECKNTKGPVGSADFGTFVDILRQATAPFGAYVSLDGFTGIKGSGRGKVVKKLSDAAQSARDAHKDGMTILLLDGEDVEDVVMGRRSLVSTLWAAYEFVVNL